MTKILRASCWVDFHHQGQLEIVIQDGASRPTLRATFTSRDQLLELAEKLRLVGEAMPVPVTAVLPANLAATIKAINAAREATD